MRRFLTLAIIGLPLVFPGCADMADEGESAANPTLVGKWDVVSVDGKAVPEEGSIRVDYRQDGQVDIKESGDLTAVPSISQSKVKRSFDETNTAPLQVSSIHLKMDGMDLQVKRSDKNPAPGGAAKSPEAKD